MSVLEAHKRYPEPPAAPNHKSWWRDFEWRKGQIIIRKTGVPVSLNYRTLHEILNWALYLALLHVISWTTHLKGQSRPRLWFAPDRPRPWYLIRGAAMWAGMDMAHNPQAADASFYFDDSTYGQLMPVLHGKPINHGCTNISKSYVARVFEDVFGYPLALDPRLATGEIIEKPEINGVHGGRVVMAPCAPQTGMVYQYLIDTCDEQNCCRDLRTPCSGGKPILVWIKIKTPQGRFSIHNRKAYLAKVSDIFSSEELALIRQFTGRMGLDWGGLDILRDRKSGRIYIVDVNKTDLGPLIALSWWNKVISMTLLARALRKLVDA